ncbi:TadE/TadG family type IV pilus assembly protein [Sphingomonas pruni]|uniref:TadE/TadG family type IV pilus assembly protein n=1 Tax=Sphingomonas pruni TaxID=40683 RepID=UPI000831C035|nr:TadE/TadG family type IV pilus assembly protein [Sphingomonas pruni]
MKAIRALLRSTHGGTAAEFGLLTPLLLSFMIGTVDLGRFLWTCNRAEKATQMGVRYAVTNDVVPGGLATYDFAVAGGIPQGDPIPLSSFGGADCNSAGGTVTCTCKTGATCPTLTPINTAAFNAIVTQMQRFYPSLTADNVTISYEYSGLGYAGDPNGIQVSPLITVKLKNMTFTPMLFRFFGSTSLNLPAYAASLTLEDGKTG